MNLVHYASKPLRRVYSTLAQEEPMVYTKPNGLWVSVDSENGDGWRDWCLTENFREESLICQTPIRLVEPDNVLMLCDVLAVRVFDERYGSETRFGHTIDWRKAAGDYKGIIIAPYQWSLRLPLQWYYTWDCASGCFWDASAIEVGR